MAYKKRKHSRSIRQLKKVRRAPKAKLVRSKPQQKISKLKPIRQVKLTKAEKLDPRRVWSALRKLGLIRSKRDARRIRKGDKGILRQINPFRQLIAGKAEVFRVSKKDAKRYKAAGYNVVEENVILPKEPKTKRTQKGRYIRSAKKIKGGRIITVLTPYSYGELQTGLDKLEKDAEIKGLLKRGWRFALKFFVNYSYATLPNVELLREYLEHYQSIAPENNQVLQNLELMIFLVDNEARAAFGHQEQRDELRKKRRREWRREHGGSSYNAKKYQRWKRFNPAGYEARLETMREVNKRYRARVKSKKLAAKRKRNVKPKSPRRKRRAKR